MKKLTILIAMLMTTSAWADWVLYGTDGIGQTQKLGTFFGTCKPGNC